MSIDCNPVFKRCHENSKLPGGSSKYSSCFNCYSVDNCDLSLKSWGEFWLNHDMTIPQIKITPSPKNRHSTSDPCITMAFRQNIGSFGPKKMQFSTAKEFRRFGSAAVGRFHQLWSFPDEKPGQIHTRPLGLFRIRKSSPKTPLESRNPLSKCP